MNPRVGSPGEGWQTPTASVEDIRNALDMVEVIRNAVIKLIKIKVIVLRP